jgi:hypothetical protein
MAMTGLVRACIATVATKIDPNVRRGAIAILHVVTDVNALTLFIKIVLTSTIMALANLIEKKWRVAVNR